MARYGLDKEKVIQKAAELANERGLNNLSLKELADSLGIRPPSLYNHIKSLDELKHGMMLYALSRMTKEVTVAVIGKSEDDAIRAMCKAYYLFAINNPGLYESMQWYNRFEDEAVADASQDFIMVIDKVLLPYKLNDEQKQHVFCLLRGLVHGFSSLAAFGGFSSEMPLENHFEWAVNVTIKNLRSIFE